MIKAGYFFSLIVVVVFLISCAPQMTDEELEAELSTLTPEEREELLADLEAKENVPLAGYMMGFSTKLESD